MALALMLGGCTRSSSLLEPGNYRAVLAVPGGDLPFQLTVNVDHGITTATIQNGPESVHITEIERVADQVVLKVPGYANRLELHATEAGYRGDAVMVRPGGKTLRLPLSLTPHQSWRFFPSADERPANINGRWAITFSSDGNSSPAIGEFTQQGAHVTATILDPAGDHRFIEGEVRGQDLLLSRFDGGSAFLYHATLQADGSLVGKWWSGAWHVSDLVAHRDEQATLTDPAATKVPATFSFSFPDLDGKTVSSTDTRFQGKVMVVSLGGSWCPNCHDEAAFLLPLYHELKNQGLEVVFLEFEHFGDMAESVAANRRFVKQLDIPWPMLIAGTSERESAASKVPDLGKIYAFPTTLVIDRSGKVRDLHSGFTGPATGAHYQSFKTEFTTLVKNLLAEPR
jgi:peroxiredoxin